MSLAQGNNTPTRATLITYNAALADTEGAELGNDQRSLRRDAIIEQLSNRKLCADVVCMQEVYYGEDVHIITSTLANIYKYSFSTIHDSSGKVPMNGFVADPSCPRTEFLTFTGCLQANDCPSDLSDQDACTLENCKAEFSALLGTCDICLRVAATNLTHMVEKCTNLTSSGPFQAINNPGLVLLSRRPIQKMKYTDLHPNTQELYERGVLQAEVKNLGLVACTHLTFYLDLPYAEVQPQEVEGFSSRDEQGAAEVGQLVEMFAREKIMFLIGDVNVGPRVGNIPPRHPEYFGMLADKFCVDVVRQCTFCTSPENAFNTEYNQSVVDSHIFSRCYKSVRKARILDDNVVQGYPMSPQYGVMQQFKRTWTTRRRKHH